MNELEQIARELSGGRWGSFEVGEDEQQRRRCRYLRTSAIGLAAEVLATRAERQAANHFLREVEFTLDGYLSGELGGLDLVEQLQSACSDYRRLRG